MIKRDEYKPYIYIERYSTKNEPLPNRYPDMYEAYDNFSKFFGIPKENFILTNGCENALRIALLALKVKSLGIETPGWALVKVIAESLNIETKNINLKSDKNGNVSYDTTPCVEAAYITPIINNFIIHDFWGHSIDRKKINYFILDETYSMRCLLNSTIPDDKIIIIGSFSKAIDPGIRLGYILFPKKYNSVFQMLREQYISSDACKTLSQLDRKVLNNMAYSIQTIKEDNNTICHKHKTYNTYCYKKCIDLPYKEFNIDGKTFYRYGVLQK